MEILFNVAKIHVVVTTLYSKSQKQFFSTQLMKTQHSHPWSCIIAWTIMEYYSRTYVPQAIIMPKTMSNRQKFFVLQLL